MKEINFFRRAEVSAQPDQVAFVADNINQLVLAEESENRRVALDVTDLLYQMEC